GFTGVESGRKREDRASRGWHHTGDGCGSGVPSRAESVAQAWESFALIALCCRGLCPHSQTVFGRGAVSLPGSFLASILPGLRLLDWPVKLPSLREGDR